MNLKHLLFLAVLPALGHAQVHTSIQKVVDKNPTWYYTFEDKDDLAAPTVGTEKLIFCTPGDDPVVGRPNGLIPTPVLGPDENKHAVKIESNNPIKVFNPGPPATDGGNRQNTWTLLFDVKYIQTGIYHGLFEYNGDNSANADGFVLIDGNSANTSNVGVGNSGYGHPFLKTNTWYRIVFTQSWEDGKPLYRIYLDGEEILRNTEPVSLLDGRFSIGEYFWLFPSDSYSTYDYFHTAGFAYWAGKSLTEEEIASFGKSDVYPKTPFKGPHAVPGTIEAEDFDLGGQGLAYHTTEAASNTYRASEQVKIEAGPGESNYHLATNPGEWYKYTIEAPDARVQEYIFTFYWANIKAGGTFDVLIDGVAIGDVTLNVEIPNTGSNEVYEDTEFTVPVTVTAGKHVITVKTTTGGNLDKIVVYRQAFSYQGLPFLGEAFSVSANGQTVIEAEDFDIGGEGIAFHAGANRANDLSREHRANAGDGSEAVSLESRNNGLTIGNFSAGDWTAYTINVLEENSYDVFLSLATGNDDRKNYIEIDDVAYPEITSHTSGWGSFQDFIISNVKIEAGTHTLFVNFNSNFDKITIAKHVDVFPYENTPQAIPGIVQAWKFDEGGQGFTYAVADPSYGGDNNTIRQDQDVNILGSAEEGYYVFVPNFNSPSWLSYTVDVKQTGKYIATFNVLCDTGGESYTLSGGSATTGKATLPDNPGNWEKVLVPVAFTEVGEQTLKITVSGAAIGLGSIEFEKDNTYKGAPYLDAPFIIPADDGGVVIEAEDFDTGGDGISYFDFYGGTGGNLTGIYRTDGATVQIETHTDSEGGEGINIAWSSAGEWLAYSVQVEESGEYDFTIVLATTNDIRKSRLQVDDDFYPEVQLRTASWITYVGYTLAEKVTLTAGAHVLYVYYDGNFDKLIIKRNATAIQLPDVLPGYVYADREGFLNVKGFSPTASVVVYNLLGQKIAGYKTVSGNEQTRLPAKGIYVVKVQDKGKTVSFKVVSK